MTTIFFIKKTFLVVTILLATTFVITCSGQAPTNKPFMWAPQKEGQSQIDYFKSLKLKLMSRRAGLPIGSSLNHKVFLENFWGMIKFFQTTYPDKFEYLHVYFSINVKKKLVLIFAPAESESESSDLDYYYLPKKFDATNVKDFKVLPSDKKLWTGRFIDAMALTTIGLNHPDNQYPDDEDANKIPSDTRFVTYCANDIFELMFVKDYFVSKGAPISNNLNGYLGTYSLSGVPRGEFRGRYINRILLQFDFVDNRNNNKEFYLDTIPEFMKLDDSPGSNCLHVVDNGQLCPTNCPKGG